MEGALPCGSICGAISPDGDVSCVYDVVMREASLFFPRRMILKREAQQARIAAGKSFTKNLSQGNYETW